MDQAHCGVRGPDQRRHADCRGGSVRRWRARSSHGRKDWILPVQESDQARGEEGKQLISRNVAAAVLLAGLAAASLHAQGDWPGYGRDKGAQRYSPLAQINTRNVAKLVPAWSFPMQRDGLPFR